MVKAISFEPPISRSSLVFIPYYWILPGIFWVSNSVLCFSIFLVKLEIYSIYHLFSQIENRDSTNMVKNPSLNQVISLNHTRNRGLLLSTSAPLPFTSASKTGVINLDLSTEKYIPILVMSSDMLSDNGTYLQARRAGKPCLSGYSPGGYLNSKSFNQARANLLQILAYGEVRNEGRLSKTM